MHIDCGVCQLRTLRPDDAASIAEHGNDRDVWLMLRDRFPHPYYVEHARAFIENAMSENPPISLGIAVDDHVVGMVNFILGTDIERVNAEMGYWVGKAFRGRGIMTAAVKGATQYAIRQFSLTRVFAIAFVHNPGSMRVLEKAGFTREGLMRQSAIKDGVVHDQYLYGYYA